MNIKQKTFLRCLPFALMALLFAWLSLFSFGALGFVDLGLICLAGPVLCIVAIVLIIINRNRENRNLKKYLRLFPIAIMLALSACFAVSFLVSSISALSAEHYANSLFSINDLVVLAIVSFVLFLLNLFVFIFEIRRKQEVKNYGVKVFLRIPYCFLFAFLFAFFCTVEWNLVGNRVVDVLVGLFLVALIACILFIHKKPKPAVSENSAQPQELPQQKTLTDS